MADIRYVWDAGVRRYRDPRGRFVAPSTVRDAVDMSLEAGQARVAALTERFRAGEVSLSAWQRGMADTIRTMHLSSGAAAVGGWPHLRAHHVVVVEQRVAVEMAYLQNFALDVESGKQPADRRMAARAQLYAEAARGTHEDLRRRGEQAAGMDEERRVLSVGETCADCRALARKGWQPIGTLPLPGEQTRCKRRCRCRMEYRQTPPA